MFDHFQTHLTTIMDQFKPFRIIKDFPQYLYPSILPSFFPVLSSFEVHVMNSISLQVYKCYYQFKEGNSGYDAGYRNSSDGQLTQPLLSSGPGPAPPPLPPNHPSAGTSYQLGQYPQYYPPHGNSSGSRALPSAPPGIYPSLANA